ncbi:MAG: hypothetical protein A4E57_01237 [Syntrophorhabdaceae bacterium PtaU1.Bin034]|nr:MAG: hypothetical protein A4E57_01237 [Syntrophorhabdaceae bacterium PtaU1.Bin034]
MVVGLKMGIEGQQKFFASVIESDRGHSDRNLHVVENHYRRQGNAIHDGRLFILVVSIGFGLGFYWNGIESALWKTMAAFASLGEYF